MSRAALLLLLTLAACDGPFWGGQEGEDISDTDDDSGGGTSTGDGGSSDGGATGPAEGVATVHRAGEITVVDQLLTGTETTSAVGAYGNVDCAVTYTLYSRDDLDSCDSCAWAFEITTSEARLTSSLGCDLVGFSAADFDDQVFSYGYAGDYAGTGPALLYGYEGTWYAIGSVTGKGNSFAYEWDDPALWTY